MDPVNLAYPVEQSGGTWQPVVDFIGHHHVVLLVIALVAGWLIYNAWRHPWTDFRSLAREPSDERATLSGSAQVLSFKKTGATELKALGYRPTRNTRYVCKIELEVHIPGREPYLTVVGKPLNRAERAAVRPGMTVQVRVDPDDDPENVRIDFTQPIT